MAWWSQYMFFKPDGIFPFVHSHCHGASSPFPSASFSFHYCLHSFVLASPSHGISSQGSPRPWSQPGVIHPLGWMLWEAALTRLFRLSEGSGAPGASPDMEWDGHLCMLRICQTTSQTFQRQKYFTFGVSDM